MFRRRARSHPAPLDGTTVERLLDREGLDDLPTSCRRLAGLLTTVTRPPTPGELQGEAAAAAAFVVVHEAVTRPTPRRSRSGMAVVLATAAVFVAGSVGATVATTEGALPPPVQAAAHETLGVVGIVVPGITPEHADPLISRRP